MVAYTWLLIFVTLAVLAIVYIPLTEVLSGHFFPTFQEVTSSEKTNEIINIFSNAWTWGIIIFVLGLFVYGILSAQKRVPETGYW